MDLIWPGLALAALILLAVIGGARIGIALARFRHPQRLRIELVPREWPCEDWTRGKGHPRHSFTNVQNEQAVCPGWPPAERLA